LARGLYGEIRMARGSNDDGRILIVGAGPVGLSLAVELVRHGAPCRIVEKAPSPSVHSKALAIMPRTLETVPHTGCPSVPSKNRAQACSCT